MREWMSLKAPTLEDFEDMAQRAYAGLLPEFRALTGEIVIRIADFPDDDVLDELDIESPYDLLGLFQGVGLSNGSAVPATGQLPNAIWLYRRPILDYWAENDDALGWVITHVLVHEIGHHFGLSDADMEALEQEAM